MWEATSVTADTNNNNNNQPFYPITIVHHAKSHPETIPQKTTIKLKK